MNSNEFDQKFLILTPLKMEQEFLIQGFENLGYKVSNHNINNRIFFYIDTLPYVITMGGHGKVNFAINTFDSVGKLKDKIKILGVFCVGCAGSLNNNIYDGDVVIGVQTVEHDYKSNFIKCPLPKFQASEELLELFKTNISEQGHIHLGIIASGDEDITTKERAKELQNLTQADAVAWEGAGGAKACHFLNLPFLEIRGVTDSCNFTQDFDFKSKLKTAMYNCAKILKLIDIHTKK